MVNKFRVGTTTETKKGSVLLRKCAAHPRLHCLKNIHLEFLPPSTIYLDVDMGITQNLKTLYHRNLINYILEATEETWQYHQQPEKSVQGFAFYNEYNLSLIVGHK